MSTNGYLVRILEDVSNDTNHADHEIGKALKTNFRSMESYFFSELHPQVDAGLAISNLIENTEQELPDIFTIHGCRHIIDVIDSIDKIAESIASHDSSRSLNVQEAYILLCAAHLHDAGNIWGRNEHPLKSQCIIRQHKDLFYGTASRQDIFDVARVHGGISERFGDDTFRELNSDNSVYPRLSLLASILRLGDELSENERRVPNNLIQGFKTSNKSQLAYLYAQSFNGFSLQRDTLSVNLRLYPEQYLYEGSSATDGDSFIDFLERKINKIEKETRYCSLYGRPYLDIRNIQICIDIYESSAPSLLKDSKLISLDLRSGYPSDLSKLELRCEDIPSDVSFYQFLGLSDD